MATKGTKAKVTQSPNSGQPPQNGNEIAVMLGGGAPNFTLMSGAMLELHQYLQARRNAGQPLYFTMAGAGAVVGLMYLAPKNMDPETAMWNTTNFGVSDLIYEMLPINYKMFGKSGPSADAFNQIWFSLPEVRAAQNQIGMSDHDALRADWLLFLGAMMCPTDLNFFSEGFCGHPSFITDLIDFDRLNALDPNDVCIEINAFCIEERRLIDFTNYEKDDDGKPLRNGPGPRNLVQKQMVPDQLRAALAFPFIYPPSVYNNQHYFEGAAFQCLNDITQSELNNIDCFIVVDPLQAKLIGRPNNLWEAFALSIIMPTTGLAELGRQLLRMQTSAPPPIPAGSGDDPVKAAEALVHLANRVHFADFDIPEDEVHHAWGWSRTSLQKLFQIGRDAAKKVLPGLPPGPPLPPTNP